MPEASTPNDDSLPPDRQQRRLAAFSRLVEVTRALAGEIDIERVRSVVTEVACRAIDCERAGLYGFDSAANELFTSVVTPTGIVPIRVALGTGISGSVARSRKAEIVPDPPADPRWLPHFDQRTGLQTRNILAAPVVSHDDKLLGVLQLLNKRDGMFDDFDIELTAAFCNHAAAALDRAALVEEQRRRHIVDSALNTARGIQRAFMPSSLPEAAGYEAATWWLPNQAIGADYCDLIVLRDGRLGLVVADVSGHGLGPSLLMASVRAALRALILFQTSPETILSMLGKTLNNDLQDGKFITMVVAGVDIGANTLHFANAGHAPALHYSAKRNRFRDLEATGMPLGIQDPPDYVTGPTIRLDVGDIVLFCTDGIVEAMDEQGKQFGTTRLKDVVRKNQSLPLTELVKKIGADVQAHYRAEAPADDLTVLALRRQA